MTDAVTVICGAVALSIIIYSSHSISEPAAVQLRSRRVRFATPLKWLKEGQSCKNDKCPEVSKLYANAILYLDRYSK